MKPQTSVIVLGVVVGLMMLFMFADYFYFRHAGARFTAADGQRLCLRVQAIDGLPCGYAR